MAYLLGYITADGCIAVQKERKNPYTLNITSKDKGHLYKLRKLLGSNHKVSKKNARRKNLAYQIQIRNNPITSALMKLGIMPRKTYNLKPLMVPKKYFADFVRGFFDGDGSVYIYNVNGTPQIKSSFVCASLEFLENFNKRLCYHMNIPLKNVHIKQPGKGKTMIQYSINFYIDDREKLARFMYNNVSPNAYLQRKQTIFEKWKSKKRRHFIKKNYPSKIGWHLNQALV